MAKNQAVFLFLVTGLALCGGCFFPCAVEGQSATPEVNVAEQYLQAAADRERAALNLPPLRRDAALAAAARKHAYQMMEHRSISHQFANELDLAGRGSAAGARFSLISENVAQSPSAIRIHEAWMKSEGHRHNLLDPQVDSIGIAVIARGRQLFAVEDFERNIPLIAFSEQEATVAKVVGGLGVRIGRTDDAAHDVCLDEEPSRDASRAAFTMQYTTSNLMRIPDQLRSRIATGRYARAVVAACPMAQGEQFSMYRLAVLLFPASRD